MEQYKEMLLKGTSFPRNTNQMLIWFLLHFPTSIIDVLEVAEKYRRLGIASQLIKNTEKWAKDYGYKQIRAWSSQDKKEAIPMWYALDYCMCPARIWVDWCQKVVDGFYVAKIL